MSLFEERRSEPRKPAHRRAVIVGSGQGMGQGMGLELACYIVDVSPSGLRLRLERNLALPKTALVIEIHAAVAHEVEVMWRKGMEAGCRSRSQSSLRGLVPERLAAARDAWKRAGGR